MGHQYSFVRPSRTSAVSGRNRLAQPFSEPQLDQRLPRDAHPLSRYRYPNGVGPGVYDIHSPRVPSTDEMRELLEKALAVLTPAQLWVNPDCGLKTRGWPEVNEALTAMVQAARELRGAVAT